MIVARVGSYAMRHVLGQHVGTALDPIRRLALRGLATLSFVLAHHLQYQHHNPVQVLPLYVTPVYTNNDWCRAREKEIRPCGRL
jgi:hypothetical protein